MTLLDDLRRVVEGDFWRSQDRDALGRWGSGDASVPGAERQRVNLEDPELADQDFPVRAALKAFAARADELAQPTYLSRRIAAKMRDDAVERIVTGDLPWSARKVSKSKREELLDDARDELELNNSGPLGGLGSGDLKRPVDIAAQREFDEWLAERVIPPKPPATEYTGKVADAAKIEIIKAVNAGVYDSGGLRTYGGPRVVADTRRRDVPTSVQGISPAGYVAAARRQQGEPLAADAPLDFEDYPVVRALDEWLQNGMEPLPAGAPAVQRRHPARESLLTTLRRIGERCE